MLLGAWPAVMPLGFLHHPEMDTSAFARLQRFLQAVDAVAEIGVMHR